VTPFFLLNVKKDRNYSIFNPVDNREYEINYEGFRILEHCDGVHTPEEIALIFAQDFGRTRTSAMEDVSAFLCEMTRYGMVSWRSKKTGDAPTWGPPETVFWDITSRCNLRCSHCYYFGEATPQTELSSNEIKRVIYELAAFGVSNLIFSGGEPFLREDLLTIISSAAIGVFSDVSIATNGTLISRRAAKKLKSVRVNVQISIDGDTPALHDMIRGVDGAFKGALRGIRLLQEEGVPVTVCTVATANNVERIPAIIELMRNLRVDNYRVQGLVPVGQGKNNMDKLGLAPGRMKELVEFLESQSIPISSYNFTLSDPPIVPVDFSGTGACAAATTSCSITSGGDVVPCTHLWGLRADNVRNHTFQWIWDNSPILRYFRSIALHEVKGNCRECRWLVLCHGGCKAENYLSGDIFGSNQSCWVADSVNRSANEGCQ